MKAFRERNPLIIGAIGVAVLGLLAVLAFNAQDLPFLGGTEYRAAFAEIGGLKAGDDVTIAGVRVGQVRGMELDGDHVTVTFRVKGQHFGTGTGAAIKVKTLLGQDYLALQPAGPGQLPAGSTIPVARTTPPYNVVQALGQLTTETGQIDTDQLARSLDTLSAAFQDSPAAIRQAVSGLSRLSQTIASRDSALQTLLAHANRVTKVLASRSGQVTQLVQEGNSLLTELEARHAVIDSLLKDTAALGTQLSGLVHDNQAQIGPALDQINGVLAVLRHNKASLEHGIALMAPFLRLYTNAFGTGRWFESYIQNLGALPGGVRSSASGSGQALPAVAGGAGS